MNCREASRLLSDAQERKPSLPDRALLKLHIMMCSRCRNFSEQMAELRHLSRTYAKGKDITPGKDSSPVRHDTHKNGQDSRDRPK